MKPLIVALALVAITVPQGAYSSTAYGSINNFDVVNDTGVPCHGFEIEINDIRSTDISYTYDWNRYGVPQIREDNTDPLHPKVFVTYSSPKNPDGSWAAYTAVPAGPILPTDGHQFTNPELNFGGEHFGVGFYGVPSAIKYNWLIDDGAGNLIYGGAVYIGTPTFTYYPPVAPAPAQVQAVIELPEPVEAPVMEFGQPAWLKVITTETHNNNRVELRDLVSDDPDNPTDTNWANGEPEEVEVEWQLLQTEFGQPGGGANGEQIGVAEELPNGDEVITRRYEFFKYVGPVDAETGEAQADSVGPDDLHGDGIKEIGGVEVDLSTVDVVGDYIGAQMAGFDAAGQIGLIDHLQDGNRDVPYVDRSIVIGGAAPVVTTRTGDLPDGMFFDESTGILSGTPTVVGVFPFTIHSVDSAAGDVTMDYELTVLESGIVEPPHSAVSTQSSPIEGGETTGYGEYGTGALVTIEAFANAGYEFVNWTENGEEVSASSVYSFLISGPRDFVANFVELFTVDTSANPVAGGTTSGDGTYASGSTVTVVATANPGYTFLNWTEDGGEVSTDASYEFAVDGNRSLVANFDAPALPVLHVVRPNGGETLYKGTTEAITWESTGAVGSNVKITLRLGARSLVLAASTPNDGAFDWNVPTNIPNHSSYYVIVESTTDPAINDRSDGLFTIARGTVAVTRPNGGETFTKGSVEPITWIATASIPNVKIVLRLGTKFLVLTNSTPNDGSFDWIVPALVPTSSSYFIRIESATSAATYGQSDGLFRIQ